jgi:hypothetical protein
MILDYPYSKILDLDPIRNGLAFSSFSGSYFNRSIKCFTRSHKATKHTFNDVAVMPFRYFVVRARATAPTLLLGA